MIDHAADQPFTAIAFVVRSRLYALEQRGTAILLPWLQRFTGSSPAPGLPSWCLGLLNVRGTVQMAIDLGSLLGNGQSEISDDTRLIFIEHGLAQLGLLVDAEIGVRYMRPSGLSSSSPPELFVLKTALLDEQPVAVLDGGAIIRYVAEELEAPAHVE